MAAIYQNAYVTLAATGSSVSDDGFVSNIETGNTEHQFIGISPDGTKYPVYARPKLRHSFTVDDKSPLLKRGWVYQERLLSPRILHFGSQELWWECNKTCECECGHYWGEYMDMPKEFHHSVLASPNLDRLPQRWRCVVEEYSQLNLTRKSDRLPALSGIAKQFHRIRPCRYLFGLWEDTLVEDLCWTTYHPSIYQSTDKRGPSWSWVSVDGAVGYPGNDQLCILPVHFQGDKYCRALNAQWTSTGLDTIGKIGSGALLISAWIVHAILLPIQYDFAHAAHPKSVLSRQYNIRASNVIASSFMEDHLLSESDKVDRTIFCILDEEDYAIALKCIDSANNAFERIGFATWTNRESVSQEREWHSEGQQQLITLV
ncbi:hypothetical protein LHYA1_G007062 [Lachnellula hyalina]|uniref:Heterokaryon incompatibility domain-containing protein n=1 Tax=Lachnellula hyalina TaxID=1316788 RepID=A0A8H8TZ22_9HELO|nr:uncharacterized protein LHYA1_G007062 [Lachnellula hyalina]TVY24506.1 hypothetical protein LHYA1_G007062 [Lachnellula hyalina]